MKHILQILTLFLILQSGYVKAQIVTRTVRATANAPASGQKKFDQYVTTTDVNGRPFKNILSSVEGSPYFIDSFRYAKILLSHGSGFENIQVKIDMHRHEVHLIADDEREIIADEGLIKEIVLADSANGKWFYYYFQSGYPSIDKNNSNNFYQVLSDGNTQLLKLIKKEIVQTQDVMSFEIRKEFVQYDEYYFFRDGEIIKLKRDKDFVLSIMKNEEQKIKEYLKDKKINFKNISMLTTLFNYYNTLIRGF